MLEKTVISWGVHGAFFGLVQIKVNAQERTLVIIGERRRPTEAVAGANGEGTLDAQAESEPKGPQTNKYKRRFERQMGKFECKFNLSDNADLEQVSARCVPFPDDFSKI